MTIKQVVEEIDKAVAKATIHWLETQELHPETTYDRSTYFFRNQQLTRLKLLAPHVTSDVSVNQNQLTSLVGSPIKVDGSFDCSNNKLTSFLHSPMYVGNHFTCSFNQITTLEYFPRIVCGNINIEFNEIQSYHNIHKLICAMGLRDDCDGLFVCDKASHMLGLSQIMGLQRVMVRSDDKLTTIFNTYLHDTLLLQDALLDGGYFEQAKL